MQENICKSVEWLLTRLIIVKTILWLNQTVKCLSVHNGDLWNGRWTSQPEIWGASGNNCVIFPSSPAPFAQLAFDLDGRHTSKIFNTYGMISIYFIVLILTPPHIRVFVLFFFLLLQFKYPELHWSLVQNQNWTEITSPGSKSKFWTETKPKPSWESAPKGT